VRFEDRLNVFFKKRCLLGRKRRPAVLAFIALSADAAAPDSGDAYRYGNWSTS